MKRPYKTIILILAVVLIGVSGWLLYNQFASGRMPVIRIPICREIYHIDEHVSGFELISAYNRYGYESEKMIVNLTVGEYADWEGPSVDRHELKKKNGVEYYYVSNEIFWDGYDSDGKPASGKNLKSEIILEDERFTYTLSGSSRTDKIEEVSLDLLYDLLKGERLDEFVQKESSYSARLRGDRMECNILLIDDGQEGQYLDVLENQETVQKEHDGVRYIESVRERLPDDPHSVFIICGTTEGEMLISCGVPYDERNEVPADCLDFVNLDFAETVAKALGVKLVDIPEIYLSNQEKVVAQEEEPEGLPDDTIESSSLDKSESPVKESSSSPSPAPPHCVRFDNIKEYQDFFFVADLDDSDFQKYIRKRSFDMNGIRSKEDLTALTSKLLPVPFPVVAGAHLTTVEILPEYDQLYLRYEYGIDVCTFRIDYTDLLQTEQSSEVEENLQLWNEAVFDEYSYDMEQNAHYFFEENNGCTVLYRYFGSEDNARGTIEKATTFISAVKPLKETSDLTKDGLADLPIKEPDCISFQTIETYWGFFLSADQSDERFMMYIEKNGYDRNGIRSKEDFFALTAKLMSVPFPVVGGANLTYAEILPEYNQINLQYMLRSGDVCTFLIDYSDMLLTEQVLELEENLQSWNETVSDDYAYFVRQHAGKILEENIQPWNETIFDDYSYDEKQNVHQSMEEINGCSVLYSYYGSEADAHAIMEEHTNFISAAGFSIKKGE